MRGETIPEDKKEFPKIGNSIYLVRYLSEIGFCGSNGMGASPLQFQEIAAWAALMGLELTPFEARAIREMSVAYVYESRSAGEKGAFAPYTEKKATPAEISSRLKGFLRNFNEHKNKGK